MASRKQGSCHALDPVCGRLAICVGKEHDRCPGLGNTKIAGGGRTRMVLRVEPHLTLGLDYGARIIGGAVVHDDNLVAAWCRRLIGQRL
jgi:hypothetical protein